MPTKAFLVAKIRNFHIQIVHFVIKDMCITVYRGNFRCPCTSSQSFVSNPFLAEFSLHLVWAPICKCSRSPGINSIARIYRPSVRENKPKTLFQWLNWACFFPKTGYINSGTGLLQLYKIRTLLLNKTYVKTHLGIFVDENGRMGPGFSSLYTLSWWGYSWASSLSKPAASSLSF
jgi:hypothetical protein